MKIALVIDTWFPAIGGGQINGFEISKILAEKGQRIDIITRNNGIWHEQNIKGLKIIRLGKKSEPIDNISRLFFLVKAFFIIKKNNYDLVHLHAFLPGLLAPIIRLFNKPVVFTVHGTRMFEKDPKTSFGFWLEKIILTKIKYDCQISVTRAFMNFKNVNKNIVYIPNGIDLKKFQGVKVPKARYPKILWVGRFDPVKRVDLLINAMKIVNTEIPQARLTLVGYGSEEQKMKNLVKLLNVKNVEFVGKKEGLDLIKEYKSSHVFVLPSASEGQPLTIIEALASGLPIVATKTGGIPEILQRSKAILIDSGNTQSLAGAIIKSLTKNEFKANFTISANKISSWKEVADNTKSLYQKFVK